MNRSQQAARLALRQRAATSTTHGARRFATQPPPPAGQPAPNFAEEKSGGMGPAFIGLVAVTGGAIGAWWYYGQVCLVNHLMYHVY